MKRMVTVLAVLAALLGGACSAEGGVNTDGDGVEIRGDVDEEKNGQ